MERKTKDKNELKNKSLGRAEKRVVLTFYLFSQY
jgi:hypothetical protein